MKNLRFSCISLVLLLTTAVNIAWSQASAIATGKMPVSATQYSGSFYRNDYPYTIQFNASASGEWSFASSQPNFGPLGVGIPADRSFRLFGSSNGRRISQGVLLYQVQGDPYQGSFNGNLITEQLKPGQTISFYMNDLKDPNAYVDNRGQITLDWKIYRI